MDKSVQIYKVSSLRCLSKGVNSSPDFFFRYPLAEPVNLVDNDEKTLGKLLTADCQRVRALLGELFGDDSDRRDDKLSLLRLAQWNHNTSHLGIS